MKESEIQRQILDGLAAEHIFAFRLNSVSFAINKRFIRAHSLGPGAADILALPMVKGYVHSDENLNREVMHIQPTWIEVKAPNGRQSPEQKSFQAHVESLGHLYVVARSFDDVRALWLERCEAGESQ